MAVTIEADPEGVRKGTPRELSTGLRPRSIMDRQFDFTPDGERLLLVAPAGQDMRRLTVDLNWQARLEQ